MSNTTLAKLAQLSDKNYKEWYNKTVLVQSCDNAYEGEFDIDKREIDIPVYHDLSIHKTTIKENELQPADPELIKASTKRVTIDRGRYAHWGQTSINQMLNSLSSEDSIVREKLTNRWAREAEDELAKWVVFENNTNTIDLTASGVLTGQVVDKDTCIKAMDILKGLAIENKMSPDDFTLFVSEKLVSVFRDAKIQLASQSADKAFEKGVVGEVDGVKVAEIECPCITHRDSATHLVDAEYAIWKTKDGIQYVVPYRNTVEYEITPDKVLLGGKGYQMVEYYDFFNIYPARLWKVKMQYKASATFPTA